VFVDFEGGHDGLDRSGSMVFCVENIKAVSLHFLFELTQHLRSDGENLLVVQVDSTERTDIPPFGYESTT